MIELKCPFCGHKLSRKNINDIMCSNEKCVSWKGNFYGSKDLWQALIDKKEECDNFEQHYNCLSHVFKHQIEVNDFLRDDANKLQKKLDIAVGELTKTKTAAESILLKLGSL